MGFEDPEYNDQSTGSSVRPNSVSYGGTTTALFWLD